METTDYLVRICLSRALLVSLPDCACGMGRRIVGQQRQQAPANVGVDSLVPLGGAVGLEIEAGVVCRAAVAHESARRVPQINVFQSLLRVEPAPGKDVAGKVMGRAVHVDGESLRLRNTPSGR